MTAQNQGPGEPEELECSQIVNGKQEQEEWVWIRSGGDSACMSAAKQSLNRGWQEGVDPCSERDRGSELGLRWATEGRPVRLMKTLPGYRQGPPC